MSKMGSRSRTHTPVMSRQNSMSMEDMHPVEVSQYKYVVMSSHDVEFRGWYICKLVMS